MTTQHDEATDLQIAPADLVLAIKLAEKQGMDIETYLKMVIHEALIRETKAS